MKLFDSHCHIHDEQYGFDVDAVLKRAEEKGVEGLVCIGTSAIDSQNAVKFVEDKPNCYATIGLHPHEATLGEDDFEVLAQLVNHPKVVGIGEFGLDYYYENSPKEDQIKALRYQLELAASSNKPCVFHIRDAFEDFWPIFDEYVGIRGVIHSFTATEKELNEAINRGLYISLNGIMTFTKNADQLAAAKAVPIDKLVLETDAPYLTPTPLRGKVNEPSYVELVAEFLSRLRGESKETLSEVTTGNARSLFGI
jgi:TatD DNase family protein